MRTKTVDQADKILRVAARLFATHRFHEARMEDIAAAAEVAKGTIYRYFKDKDELYLALLARANEQMTARLDEELPRVEGATARLEAFVGTLIAYFDENPYFFDLIQHAEAMQRPGRPSPTEGIRHNNARRVMDILEEGRESGEFRVADSEFSTYLLLGGMRAVFRFGRRPRPRGLARQLVAHFLNGACARPD